MPPAQEGRGEAGPGSFEVPTDTLDGLTGADGQIDLLKLDVEGHEAAVLHGATGLLGRGAVRDIIFEEHAPYPSPTTRLLEGQGY